MNVDLTPQEAADLLVLVSKERNNLMDNHTRARLQQPLGSGGARRQSEYIARCEAALARWGAVWAKLRTVLDEEPKS